MPLVRISLHHKETKQKSIQFAGAPGTGDPEGCSGAGLHQPTQTPSSTSSSLQPSHHTDPKPAYLQPPAGYARCTGSTQASIK